MIKVKEAFYLLVAMLFSTLIIYGIYYQVEYYKLCVTKVKQECVENNTPVYACHVLIKSACTSN